MEFALTEEQLELQEMVREFVAKEITPYAAEMDRENHAREGLMEKAADMGLLNVVVPEEYGGMGLDSVTVAVIYEELGKGCAGVATSIAANSLASYPILLAGTEEQKKAHCDLLNEGKLAAFALTEPGAGSDVGSLKTTYTRRNGKIYLNGSKCFITSSAYTPYIVVMARDGASPDKPVYTEWFVDMSKPGIKVTKLEKLGLRMDSCCEITFDDVELDEKDMFGREGNGFNRVKEEFDHERFLVALTNYGTAMCAFEDAARYANQRVQFGEAIGRFQLIQEKFAHMAIKLNSMKNMLYEAAWKADNGTITSGDAAMCKYFCANAAFEVVDSAMQVLGGVGIAGNHRISRFWRDLRVDRVSGGSDEMQILTLGRAVLKQYR